MRNPVRLRRHFYLSTPGAHQAPLRFARRASAPAPGSGPPRAENRTPPTHARYRRSAPLDLKSAAVAGLPSKAPAGDRRGRSGPHTRIVAEGIAPHRSHERRQSSAVALWTGRFARASGWCVGRAAGSQSDFGRLRCRLRCLLTETSPQRPHRSRNGSDDQPPEQSQGRREVCGHPVADARAVRVDWFDREPLDELGEEPPVEAGSCEGPSVSAPPSR